MACILLLSSAVWVHDSQAYRKMAGFTRERISRILKLREILLSFPTGFNLVDAAVVCAILKSISGLEPSSVITDTRQCYPRLGPQVHGTASEFFSRGRGLLAHILLLLLPLLILFLFLLPLLLLFLFFLFPWAQRQRVFGILSSSTRDFKFFFS